MCIFKIYDVQKMIFRELFGVEICAQDELLTLKNITKAAMESEICQMPCLLNYPDLDHLPGNESFRIEFEFLKNSVSIVQMYKSPNLNGLKQIKIL